jgi:hypothetical protein
MSGQETDRVEQSEMFEWTVHPFMESPKKAVISILAPVLVPFLVYLWMREWLWVGLAMLLIISSEFPFFIKTRYRMDGTGVTQKRGGVIQFRSWEQIKSFYPDKTGVLISPFLNKTWLENFRGLYLQYGRHREQVIGYLENKLKPSSNSK